MVAHVAQLHIVHAVQQLDQLFVALGHRGAQLVAVDIEVVKQPRHAALSRAALGRFLNVAEHRFQRFVQFFVLRRPRPHIAKQLAGQDEKALLLHQPLARFLCLGIGQFGVVKAGVAGLDLACIDVVAQALGYVAVKHRAQHIVFEIPAIHRTAQLVRDCPDRPVQLLALLFFLHIRHSRVLLLLRSVNCHQYTINPRRLPE